MEVWKDKVVIVTGGSKGLGLEIARAFGRKGAKTVLLARTESDLEAAVQQLTDENIDACYRVTDVSSDRSVELTFDEVAKTMGQIDVLVNNVGRSTRTNIEQLDLDEAIEMMDVNYFSALRCTKFALPELLKSQGHIVNIGSLVSKTAWPFMTPYTASKHALAALSYQLRVELRGRLHSLLVCSGPISRTDSGHRYDDKVAGLPSSAAKPGAGANVKMVCPVKLSERIVKACEAKKSELVIPFKAKIVFAISSISTRLGDWFLRKNQKD